MQQTFSQSDLVPVLSSSSGSCLTPANWYAVGIQWASFYLNALLMKPGLEALSQGPDLATYVNWSQGLVVNASLIEFNVDGLYQQRSQYDGRLMVHSAQEIWSLIARLNPTLIILPKGAWKTDPSLWQSLPDSLLMVIPFSDLIDAIPPQRPYGVYYAYQNMETFLEQRALYQDQMAYIAGDLGVDLIRQLKENSPCLIESDRPASDACLGQIYSGDSVLSLSDEAYEFAFETLDQSCCCPTCSQHLTKAYLHHLLANTPLLCQRLLIQHNVAITTKP
jgi:queuine tRNA-ribosyltransferase